MRRKMSIIIIKMIKFYVGLYAELIERSNLVLNKDLRKNVLS
jgi:hypothetical protein